MKPIMFKIFSFDSRLKNNITTMSRMFTTSVDIRIWNILGPYSSELGQNRSMLYRTTKCTRASQEDYLRQWFTE